MPKTAKEGYTIIVKLPEECGYAGYSVKCTYKYIQQKEKYELSMWLMDGNGGHGFGTHMQEIDTKYISSQKKDVEKDIRRIVTDASLSGYFDPYIENYNSEYIRGLLYV